MAIRNFAASTTKRGSVVFSTSGITARLDAIDTALAAADAKVVLALAQTDIDASVAAEAAVAAIKTEYDAAQTANNAAQAELLSTVYSSALPVTVVINGDLTHNEIRRAFDNVLRAVAQQTGIYPEG